MSIIIDSIVYHSVTACLLGWGIRAALILGQSLRTKASYQSKYFINNKSKAFLAIQNEGRKKIGGNSRKSLTLGPSVSLLTI
jgi:hypothetical protein